MIRKIFNISILVFLSVNFYSQEPVFSQFYFNPLYMNPAMSGMDNNFRLFLNNKNQWSKVPGQFNTTCISFDSWQNFSNSSLSMLYSSGIEGESNFKTDKFHFGGAYRLFDVFPSPLAWQFGFHYQNITKKLDWSRLVFSDQLDPYLGNVNSTSFILPNSNSFNSSNLALGTVLTYHIKRGTKSRRFHLPIDLDVELGFAVHEFVQRGNSFVNDGVYRNKRRYTYHGSMIWPFSKGRVGGGVKHSALFVNQGNLSTFQIGIAETWIYPLHLGLFYRQQMTVVKGDFDRIEALYFIFGYQKVIEKSNLSLTMSYSRDFTVSELGTYSGGTNEISIILESIEGGLFQGLMKSRRHSKNKYRSIPCYSKFNTTRGL